MAKQSKYEKLIKSWFPDEECVANSRKLLTSGRELDLYFPKFKLAIEVDGLLFHTEIFGRNSEYHKSKFMDCMKSGIFLMSFSDEDFKRNQTTVKDVIARHLGKCTVINNKITTVRFIENFDPTVTGSPLYIPQTIHKLVGVFDKRGLALVVSFSYEQSKDIGDVWCIRMVHFRHGVYILGGVKQAIDFFFSKQKPTVLRALFAAEDTPLYQTDIVGAGLKFVNYIEPANIWVNNTGTLLGNTDKDTSAYSRYFTYGYCVYEKKET